MIEGTDANPIAGFWRRIGAFVIDSIILGILGVGLGLFLEREFVQLGGWGRSVGFFIALAYFGLFNSRIFAGQTIGKKLVNIRVVDAANKSISVFRSFARFIILGGPFFLNGAQLPHEMMESVWLYPISLIGFGGLLSVVYLYIFNRATRQSLHDLAVGTYVVTANQGLNSIGTIWRPHLIVVGGLFLASAMLPLLTSYLSQSETFEGVLSAQAALSQHPAVTHVAVSSGTTAMRSTGDGTKTTQYINARAFLRDDIVSDSELAKELAVVLVNSDSRFRQMDVILIVLTYGYDIGIASSWTNYSHVYTPTDLIAGT